MASRVIIQRASANGRTTALVPLAGAAAYLLWARSDLHRPIRIGAVAGGIAVVAAAFGLTLVRIGY